MEKEDEDQFLYVLGEQLKAIAEMIHLAVNVLE